MGSVLDEHHYHYCRDCEGLAWRCEADCKTWNEERPCPTHAAADHRWHRCAFAGCDARFLCKRACPHVDDPWVCDECLQQKMNFKPEAVDHPVHYGGANDPLEHVKVAEAKGWTKDAFIYNCTRYLWRFGLKDGNPILQDLKKARWYLDRKIRNLEQEEKKK